MKFDPKVKEAITQLSLRIIPFLPANEMLAVVQSLRRSQDDVEKQVEEALDSLKKSAALVGRLEQDLKSRMETVQKLQEEHKKFSELSHISRDQAAALADMIEGTLGKSARRERMVALIINLVAGAIVFVLGVIFAVPVTKFLGGFFK